MYDFIYKDDITTLNIQYFKPLSQYNLHLMGYFVFENELVAARDFYLYSHDMYFIIKTTRPKNNINNMDLKVVVTNDKDCLRFPEYVTSKDNKDSKPELYKLDYYLVNPKHNVLNIQEYADLSDLYPKINPYKNLKSALISDSLVIINSCNPKISDVFITIDPDYIQKSSAKEIVETYIKDNKFLLYRIQDETKYQLGCFEMELNHYNHLHNDEIPF